MAALWAMEKIEFYSIEKKFALVTDHKAIEEIKNEKVFSSYRVERWFYKIKRLKFDVVYRQGSEMKQADAMSRCFALKCQDLPEGGKELTNQILKIHVC